MKITVRMFGKTVVEIERTEDKPPEPKVVERHHLGDATTHQVGFRPSARDTRWNEHPAPDYR